ncbi:hypothetical protein CRYUN_Cryun34aG0090900 [Craigia yunnanensis]
MQQRRDEQDATAAKSTLKVSREDGERCTSEQEETGGDWTCEQALYRDVTMLDIVAHIADDDHDQMMGGSVDGVADLERKMMVPVSSIIGHCLEGLSLWTLKPNTSILECMELFSKGTHRALVPMGSQMENIQGVELVESASSYKMLTQMDLLKFLKDHASELEGILSSNIKEIGAINENVYAINDRTKVIEAIKCLRTASINAVLIVQTSDDIEEDHIHLINGKGWKLIGLLVGLVSLTDIIGVLRVSMLSKIDAM